MKYLLIAVLALLSAIPTTVPAAAQEWQVARERFGFAGTRLAIYVDAEAAGTLRLIRGAAGSVSVASRAERGFTAAGLTHTEELTLTAVGPGPVDYLVTVPEDVRVRVNLPGSSFGEAVGGLTRSRSFEWREPERRARPAPQWLPPLDQGESTLFTTFTRDLAPATVTLPDLTNVRSLTVRLEHDRFRAETSRPLAVTEGSDHRLEIRPAAPPMDLVLTIPVGTLSFQLLTGGSTAITINDGILTTHCSPVTQQWLSNERTRVTFSPVDGALECSAAPAPRQQGTPTPRHEG